MNALELRFSRLSLDYVLSDGSSFVCDDYVTEHLGTTPERIRIRWTLGRKKAGYSRIRKSREGTDGFEGARVDGLHYRLFPACAERLPVGRTVYFKIEAL